MKITERFIYLLIILGCVIVNIHITNWHSVHYDYLMKQLEITKKICEKVNNKHLGTSCNRDWH